MDGFVAFFTVSAFSLVAFGAAGAALAGLGGTCSRACDREGRPLCERCPRRERVQDDAPSDPPPGGA
jgi:hypothetical protein